MSELQKELEQARKSMFHAVSSFDRLIERIRKEPADEPRPMSLDAGKASDMGGAAFAEAVPGVFGPEFDLDHIFKYHSPNLSQMGQYAAIRNAAKYFAQVILDNAPMSADRAAAIRKLRECVMTVNASIALHGRL